MFCFVFNSEVFKDGERAPCGTKIVLMLWSDSLEKWVESELISCFIYLIIESTLLTVFLPLYFLWYVSSTLVFFLDQKVNMIKSFNIEMSFYSLSYIDNSFPLCLLTESLKDQNQHTMNKQYERRQRLLLE